MATRRSYLEEPNYFYLGGDRDNSSIPLDSPFEFDESELWDSSEQVIPEQKKYQKAHLFPLKKSSRRSQLNAGSAVNRSAGLAVDRRSKTTTSLPVNVPDWSKILRDEYNMNRRKESDYMEDDDHVDEEDRIPPHEYLARTRMASLSVHEGVGRTLKGRDLRTVRNAIWKQTGFELD